MNLKQRILLLHAGRGEQRHLENLAGSITRLGSTLVVEDLESGHYDKILDAAAFADIVMYWPSAPAD